MSGSTPWKTSLNAVAPVATLALDSGLQVATSRPDATDPLRLLVHVPAALVTDGRDWVAAASRDGWRTTVWWNGELSVDETPAPRSASVVRDSLSLARVERLWHAQYTSLVMIMLVTHTGTALVSQWEIKGDDLINPHQSTRSLTYLPRNRNYGQFCSAFPHFGCHCNGVGLWQFSQTPVNS